MRGVQRNDAGTRGASSLNPRRGILEHDAISRVVTESLGTQAVSVRCRLPPLDVFTDHDHGRNGKSDGGQAQLRERTTAGGDDPPPLRRQAGEELASTGYWPQSSDILELGGVEPRDLGVSRQVRHKREQGVARAPAMGDPQHRLDIQMMALPPATPRAFDDSTGVDEHAVEIEQACFAAKLHLYLRDRRLRRLGRTGNFGWFPRLGWLRLWRHGNLRRLVRRRFHVPSFL